MFTASALRSCWLLPRLSRARTWILCVVLLMSTGEIFASYGEAPNLSDGMKASASGDKTPIAGSHSHHSSDSDDYDCDDDDGDGDGPLDALIGAIAKGVVDATVYTLGTIFKDFHGAKYKDEQYFYQLPFDAEYVVPFGSDIRGMERFSVVPLSVETEHVLFGFYVNGGLVQMRDGSLPDEAIPGASMIGAGSLFRYYFISPEKKVNPYLAARVGWQGLNWSYRNSIVAGDGGTISGDGLSGLDSYVGVGITIHRKRNFSFYSEMGFGGTVLGNHTMGGFHNDVFDDFAYFAVKGGVSLKF